MARHIVTVQPGDRYERWEVVKEVESVPLPNGRNKRMVLCRCTCLDRTVRVVSLDSLRGGSKSCGCWKSEVTTQRNFRHGHAARSQKSRAWNSWRGMVERCTNPKHTAYKNYGGRGVTVCQEWLNFAVFLADMGEPSEGMTLDRQNNEKGYSKDNCSWVPRSDQNRNQRSNVNVTYNGVTKCLQDWANEIGIQRQTLQWRLNRGWTVEQAFTIKPEFTGLPKTCRNPQSI